MKKLTHIIAVILTAATAFLVTPAGIALVHQYPIVAALAAALAVATTYFNPKANGTPSV